MNNLPEYLKELSEKTQKLQPFSNSLTQQLHQYTKLNNSLNFGITHYLNDSLKNSINENNLYNVNRAISQIHKTSSFQLPENALASISRISERQYDLTSAWANSLRDMPNLSSELYRITNLNDSISNISAQIAKISEISKNWSTFYEYENITSQALLFSENLTNTEEFNEEETSNKFKELIGLFKKFYNKNKKAGAKAFLVLEIILLIPSFHQYYDFLKEKPELATKQDLSQLKEKQDSILILFKEVKAELADKKEIFKTQKNCQVKLKPNKNSLSISNLPKNYEVNVFIRKPTWVYISFIDPIDGLIQTGWINRNFIEYAN